MSDPLDAMIEICTRELGIPVDPAWKAEIRTQLQVNLRHGAAVAEFPLPDDTEPAPIYRA